MTQRTAPGESRPDGIDAGSGGLEVESRSLPTRILIADPIDLARQGVRGLLNAQPDLEVVASCRTIDETVFESVAQSPDVALVGYGFSEGERLDLLRQILGDRPRLPVLIVTNRPDLDAFLSYVRAGVRGYLGGNIEAAALADAIRTLNRGGHAIEPTIMDELFLYLSRVSTSAGSLANAQDRNSPLGRLSRREREVLRLMAEGMGNKEISSALGITPGTTKTHLRHIFRKLRVSDRTGAVLAALEIDPRRLLPAA
jgi:DNA-binding NarL/FixJ family response regulator